MCKKCTDADPVVAAAARAAHRNNTTFRPGADDRRHRFTSQERSRGFRAALEGPHGDWVWTMVRVTYHMRRRSILAGSRLARELRAYQEAS